MVYFFRFFYSLGIFLLTSFSLAADPKVVVILKPVHGLVTGVMDSIAVPHLLLKGAFSPHAYSLRPSDAQALSEADVIIWVGEAMETFMERPLRSLGDETRVVELMDSPGMRLLERREGGVWDKRDNTTANANHAAHREHSSSQIDPHIWLDPENAAAIVMRVAATLSDVDPINTHIYEANKERLLGQIKLLRAEMLIAVRPIQERPFIVFHDAYQYLERYFGLNGVGTITVTPERLPGTRRIMAIRHKAAELGAVCIFSEPQFEPRILASIISETSARSGILDPLGADIPAGSDHYFTLMKTLVVDLKNCLGSP